MYSAERQRDIDELERFLGVSPGPICMDHMSREEIFGRQLVYGSSGQYEPCEEAVSLGKFRIGPDGRLEFFD